MIGGVLNAESVDILVEYNVDTFNLVYISLVPKKLFMSGHSLTF